jgi:Flp pilus assembly protein TadB
MSTVAIVVVIVAAVLIVGALLAFGPSMRTKRRERELQRRRETAVEEHREVAQERVSRADEAERRAKFEREQAEQAERRADMHAAGAADHELVREDDDPKLVEHARTNDEDADGRFSRDDSVRDDASTGRPRF